MGEDIVKRQVLDMQYLTVSDQALYSVPLLVLPANLILQPLVICNEVEDIPNL